MSAVVALWAVPGAALADGPAQAEADTSTELPLREGGSAIINGEDASADDYPMTGGLLIDTTLDAGGLGAFPLQMFVCSSTLIAPDVVLIAAHCIDPYALTFGFGDLVDTEYAWSRQADLSSFDGRATGQPWPDDAVIVADTVFHPDWDMQALQTGIALNYDIALLFLAEPVLDVPPALLPSLEESAALSEDTEVAVVGWGQQSQVDFGQTPPAGSYMIKQQGMSHIAEIGEAEFQVGLEASDVRKCHGDSGGPSFAWVGVDTEETMRLVGVTSHAYDASDCEETGGVDTRVDYYLSWIDDEMRSRCDDGSRVWCDEPGVLPTDYFEAGGEDEGDGEEDGVADGEADDADAETTDGDADSGGKAGCSHAVGAMSGLGLCVSFLAVGRRRTDDPAPIG